MSKKKVVYISDAREARESDTFAALVDSIGYIAGTIESKRDILYHARDEACEAAEDAGLNFSKFTLKKDTAGMYFCGMLFDVFGDYPAILGTDSLNEEQKQEIEFMRDHAFLAWTFESKSGTRYDIVVQYTDCDDDSDCYELTSGLYATSKNGEHREYDYNTNQWEIMSEDE